MGEAIGRGIPGPNWLVIALVLGPTLAIVLLALVLRAVPLVPPATPTVETLPTVRAESQRPSVPAVPEEVPGRDLSGLPRYPGAVRSDFRERTSGGLVLNDIRYVTPASLAEVQSFYREALRAAGWSEVDARFGQGSWTYVGKADVREVLLRLDQAGDRVLITIEQSTISVTPAAPPTITPVSPPASSPVPPGDDDDDDDND